MSPRLVFPDAHAAADALTFARRAATLDTDAAVRLQAAGGRLVMSTAVLAPRTLLDAAPTVLALRILPVDAELECDLVVEATGLAAASVDTEVSLPASAVRAAWAGIAPPQGGWERVASVSASTVARIAQGGMTAVAEALPQNPGEDVVRSTRATIWSVGDAELDGMPRGVAFAAFALGFIGGDEQAVVFQADGWRRVSLARGHVLLRVPRRPSMTAVRRTGS
ncbi:MULTISPECIES: serine/threonine-protein kinase [Microbacterium]|uniref:hypothetical protein n=1 Tax=Microbacterium TaxID=33882 RepID=UPI0010F725E2|nr:hypothetical protein [Microbacterium sp. 4NA327F11]MCK9916787.1 hypothetical protein [Microbacteriaceae bacterium K1510]